MTVTKPSENERVVGKAEELFNDWFTTNVVIEITRKMKRSTNTRKAIKLPESEKCIRERMKCSRACAKI